MPIQPNQIAPAPIQQDPQVGTPSLPVGKGMFYTKTVSGKVEAFYVNGDGQDIQITSNGEVVGINYFEKTMINGDTQPIPSSVPVSIRQSDGAMLPGDANAVNGQQIVGITLGSVAVGQPGRVSLFGRCLPGILTSMGFLPGEEVYLGETAGSFAHANQVSPESDSIIRLGVAAVADGTTGAAATDLILIREVVSNL